MSIVDINEQRIRIAEACGWTMQPIGLMKKGDAWAVPETKHGHSCIPDYLSDLNAMHEAEKVLTQEQRDQYAAHIEAWTDPNTMRQLCLNTGDPHGSCDYGVLFFYLHATAAQRAEAFLKCLGKWSDK